MSKRERSSGGGGGSSNAWMATFSDLLMLMLTFFVLLLTMSSMDAKKAGAISAAAGVLPGQGDDLAKESVVRHPPDTNIIPPLPLPSPPPVQGAPRVVPAKEIKGGGPLDQGVEKLISPLQRQGKGWLKREPASLSMHVDGEQLFEGLTLSEQGRAFIAQTASLAAAQGATLCVEVFRGTAGDRWAREQAWQFALTRADVAAQAALNSGLDGANLEVSGYGWSFGQREDRFLRHPDLVRVTLKTVLEDAADAPSSTETIQKGGSP